MSLSTGQIQVLQTHTHTHPFRWSTHCRLLCCGRVICSALSVAVCGCWWSVVWFYFCHNDSSAHVQHNLSSFFVFCASMKIHKSLTNNTTRLFSLYVDPPTTLYLQFYDVAECGEIDELRACGLEAHCAVAAAHTVRKYHLPVRRSCSVYKINNRQQKPNQRPRCRSSEIERANPTNMHTAKHTHIHQHTRTHIMSMYCIDNESESNQIIHTCDLSL